MVVVLLFTSDADLFLLEATLFGRRTCWGGLGRRVLALLSGVGELDLKLLVGVGVGLGGGLGLPVR